MRRLIWPGAIALLWAVGCDDRVALDDTIDPEVPRIDIAQASFELAILQHPEHPVTGVFIRLFDRPGDDPCDASREGRDMVTVSLDYETGVLIPSDQVRRDAADGETERFDAAVKIHQAPRAFTLDCDGPGDCRGVDLSVIRGTFVAHDADGAPLFGAAFEAHHCPEHDWEYWIGK